MARIGLALFVVLKAVAGLDCDVTFQQIRPSETGSDANATDKDAPHWVFAGRAGVMAVEPLRVFLPGTFGHPSGSSYLLKSITKCEKPTIGLSYAFEMLPDSYRNDVCKKKYGEAMTDRAKCLRDQHADAIYGGSSQPDLWQEIAPQNSITGRLTLLLSHLNQQQPGQGWNTYLDEQNQVRWDRVVMGGHSQGSGHSGYMALKIALHGAVLLSGPQDDAEVPSYWVDEKTWATTRVVAAKHANESAQDVIGANWRRMATALGWPNMGEPWDLGDGWGFGRWDYGTVVVHAKPSAEAMKHPKYRPYHCSMAGDSATPMITLPSGKEEALYALFLWPGLYDLVAEQRDLAPQIDQI